MIGSNHALIGAFSFLGLSQVFSSTNLATIGLPLGIAALASLLPDIDTPHSGLGRRMLPVSLLLSSKLGHRGFTHSLAACAMVFAGAGLLAIFRIDWILGCAAFAIGYTSHIGADWLTAEGVRLFWPNRKRYRSPVNFKTGSLEEYALGVCLAILCGIVVYYRLK